MTFSLVFLMVLGDHYGVFHLLAFTVFFPEEPCPVLFFQSGMG